MSYKKTIEVEVTQEDINKGIKGHCTKCPIALALNRVINTKYEISVGCMFIRINTYPIYHIPPEVRNFIFEFDQNNKNLIPFKFIADSVYGRNKQT